MLPLNVCLHVSVINRRSVTIVFVEEGIDSNFLKSNTLVNDITNFDNDNVLCE